MKKRKQHNHPIGTQRNYSAETMKAIETVYDGHRFRSRLEARYAVFFNALKIPYQYEAEGFDLDGEWYLPDFWLPDQQCWIEVKPPGQPTARELTVCSALASKSGKRVFMFSGDIWPEAQRKEKSARAFLTPDTYYPDKPDKPDIPPGETFELRYIMQNYSWGFCPFCKRYDIWKRVSISGDGIQSVMINDGCQNGSVMIHQDNTVHGGLMVAYTAARQARFEHGEDRS